MQFVGFEEHPALLDEELKEFSLSSTPKLRFSNTSKHIHRTKDCKKLNIILNFSGNLNLRLPFETILIWPENKQNAASFDNFYIKAVLIVRKLTSIHAALLNHPGNRWIYRRWKCKIKESTRWSFQTVFWWFMCWNFLVQQLKALLGVIRTTYIFNLQKIFNSMTCYYRVAQLKW